MGSGQHGFTHRTGDRFGQGLAFAAQFLQFFADQCGELVVGFLLCLTMTDPASREQVRAVSHIEGVRLVPLDEFQISVFAFHRLISRMAWRTCKILCRCGWFVNFC